MRRVEVTVRFLTSGEGGRRTPVASGYRGQFHYEDEPRIPHDCTQHFPESPLRDGWVPLGATVTALIEFPEHGWRDHHADRIRPGKRFRIQEGSRIVGLGVVNRVD